MRKIYPIQVGVNAKPRSSPKKKNCTLEPQNYDFGSNMPTFFHRTFTNKFGKRVLVESIHVTNALGLTRNNLKNVNILQNGVERTTFGNKIVDKVSVLLLPPPEVYEVVLHLTG